MSAPNISINLRANTPFSCDASLSKIPDSQVTVSTLSADIVGDDLKD